MSLQAPLWLLVLAAIPLAMIAQRLVRRRARRHAVRFPAAAAARAAAAAAGGTWVRHLPAAGALAAVAALAVALARPRVTVQVPIEQASIVLVIDHSGSMAATDVAPTRLGAADRAANTFIDQLPSRARVGVVTFSTTPDAAQAPVDDHAAVRAIVDRQIAGGGTDTGDALAVALQLLHGAQRNHPPAAIVLLSDGAANRGRDPVAVAAVARQEQIPIYTVALGTASGVLNIGPFSPPVPVPPDPQLMRQIASVSGGRAFDAQTADQLSSIYRGLGRRLGTVPRRREITADFAIAAAVLLVGAGALSVRSGGRLA